ncbi:MAG: ribosomal protein S18-alanine N-acetyltransferase [Herbinix sp.]|nr:ribosomal protein S18-alanine N-acetyltransferase [Herbinix sp.]
MEIRKMTETDLPEVCAIEQDTFSEPWSEEDFRNSIEDINNGYLVAVIDNKIVGYCGYWGIAGEGDIYNVAVKKDYRGQRIGYQILTALLGDAAGRGITSLTLEVRKSNEAAIHLYESLGFERAAIRRDFYSKPREDAVIMWMKPIQ